jgi:hypothetical protein
MPKPIVKTLANFYKQVVRVVSVNGNMSEPFRSTNSVLQGCALSLVLAGMPSDIWMRAIAEVAPVAKLFGFVDDRSALIEGYQVVEDTAKALNISLEVDRDMGVKTNLVKSTIGAASVKLRAKLKEAVKDSSIEVVDSAIYLGAMTTYRRDVANKKTKQRFAEARAVVTRATACPVKAFVETIITAAAIPKCAYMLENGRPPKKMLDALSSAIVSATFAKRHLRSVEVVLAILKRGHLLDPWQAWAVVTLHYYRKMYIRSEEVRRHVDELWDDGRIKVS